MTGKLDPSQLLSMGTNLPLDTNGLLGVGFDAGPALQVTGPNSNSDSLLHTNDNHTTGPYVGLLGGTVPLEGMPALLLFLNGGAYRITGPGGKDVGPFTAEVNLPAPVQWTNRDLITAVNRAAGLTLTWSGGDPNSQLVLIAGGSVDQITKAAAGFFCFAPAGASSFTVPASVLGNLPASSAENPKDAIGALLLGAVPGADFPRFSATGLDAGLAFYGGLSIKTVLFQ